MPYDTEVAYLESTGTQFIDTKVDILNVGAIGFDVEGVGQYTSAVFPFGGTSKAAEGQSTTYKGRILCVTRNDGTSNIGYVDYGNVSNDRIIYALSRVTVNKLATKVEAYPAGTTTAVNFYLFAAKDRTDSDSYSAFTRAACRIRWFKIWDLDGNLIRDLIPVRVGSVGYFWIWCQNKDLEMLEEEVSLLDKVLLM